MAQEIMVAGAIYEDVPSVRLPDSHGTFHPFTDTSDTTAVAADVAQGKTFHLADGSAATGTAAGATLVTKSITANGTYDASDDGADGYSEVTVNVSGGGGGGVDPKDVNFIDYDGTILHSYTAAEFAALTALPDNPTHDGLVAQGWNWTLSDAQSYVASCGFLTIGQMYVTASGDTEIDIELVEGRLSPYLGFAVNGTATIDWGDGSATDTVTGTSLTTQIRTRHDYATAGRYTISVRVVSGDMALFGDSTYGLLSKSATPATTNRVYTYGVLSVRVGESTSIGDYAFANCTLPSSVTIPPGLSIGNYAFQSSDVPAVTIPSNVSVGTYAFSGCLRLKRFSHGVLTSIGNSTFSSCYQLTRFVVPREVTTIDTFAFSGCTGLAELHFTSSTPPTVTSWNAFSNVPKDCIIYVPAGSLAAYTSAANYPSSSTYTYVEE